MKNKLMDNIDLFIFDMDGILFDTETVYLEYGKKLLKELNYKVTDELVEKTTGLTNEEAKEIYLEEFGRDFPYDEITLKVYNYIIDEAQKGNIALMTGAKEMLEFLSSRGKKMVMGTSADSFMANTLLESKGIKDYFSHIITADDVERGKPDPEVFLRGAGKMNINPSKTMVFEDSINGVKAAYGAGMLPVMIPDKLTPTEDIEDMLYKKFDNFLKVIEYFKTQETKTK